MLCHPRAAQRPFYLSATSLSWRVKHAGGSCSPPAHCRPPNNEQQTKPHSICGNLHLQQKALNIWVFSSVLLFVLLSLPTVNDPCWNANCEADVIYLHNTFNEISEQPHFTLTLISWQTVSKHNAGTPSSVSNLQHTDTRAELVQKRPKGRFGVSSWACPSIRKQWLINTLCVRWLLSYIHEAEERSVWRGEASGEQRKEDMEDAVWTMRAEREQLLCGLCYNRQREVISSEKTSCILCCWPSFFLWMRESEVCIDIQHEVEGSSVCRVFERFRADLWSVFNIERRAQSTDWPLGAPADIKWTKWHNSLCDLRHKCPILHHQEEKEVHMRRRDACMHC